ncbi:hypothetical protein M2271_004564 [Streptomyces sp. LBL]|uniref:hypothetical protein n=1 Tax=Streptomyces sp. LBL TaxID=2940562 RepID=UPI0024766A16|nr:hypothetical protein [Streptomyces sp. LBL]MDH6626747.1 hypothetical protein [Streptomyces sp. LBL]
MHPEIHLSLHHLRTAELRAQAEAHRLATRAALTTHAKPPHGFRTRLGWTLVEVGLRLATPRPTLTPSVGS